MLINYFSPNRKLHKIFVFVFCKKFRMKNSGHLFNNFVQLVCRLGIMRQRAKNLPVFHGFNIRQHLRCICQLLFRGNPCLRTSIGKKDVRVLSAGKKLFQCDLQSGSSFNIIKQILASGKENHFCSAGVYGLHQNPFFIDISPYHLWFYFNPGCLFCDTLNCL